LGLLTSVRGAAQETPLYRPLDADQIIEFHAARLLVLLAICGSGSPRGISGRTKLVKLDFFLRYPRFLERAQAALRAAGQTAEAYDSPHVEAEATMIRYRFGPWDPRYGDFVAFLEARGLVQVSGDRVERLTLSRSGSGVARELGRTAAFGEIVGRAQVLQRTLAAWSGTDLKELIYELFPKEVVAIPSRQEISP
jgi:hypothetical protein